MQSLIIIILAVWAVSVSPIIASIVCLTSLIGLLTSAIELINLELT